MRRMFLAAVAMVASACAEPDTETGGPGPAFAACNERVFTGDYAIASTAELDALAPYTAVTGSVIIHGSALSAVAGPSCLASIGGDLWFKTSAVVSISGFTGLQAIAGRLRLGNQLYDDPAAAVSGFDALRVIGDSAYFMNTSQVRGFDRLERVGGTLRFGRGTVDVQGMNALREVGSLLFSEVDIRSLDGLTSLAIVTGDLTFVSTVLDVATTGLGRLTTIGDRFFWEYGVLSEQGLGAFRAIETIGGGLLFSTMTGPAVMDGFAELEAVGGRMGFEGVAGVESIQGFDQLGSAGPLSFERMDDLRKIAGFERLERSDGLAILGNDQLRSVTLPDLDSIDGELSITGNPLLAALNLPRLVRLAGAFTITGNAALPRCQAEALLAVVRAHGYSGPATIEDNGAGACGG